jgi:hypothetical protein
MRVYCQLTLGMFLANVLTVRKWLQSRVLPSRSEPSFFLSLGNYLDLNGKLVLLVARGVDVWERSNWRGKIEARVAAFLGRLGCLKPDLALPTIWP